jgi:transposase
MRFDLSDEEWSALEPLLPTQRKTARVNDRRIINAILHVLRTGMPWRDLPERYGPYTTAYNRFNRWSRRGIWNSRNSPRGRGTVFSLSTAPW